jgi:hypothetical protein
LLLNVEITTSGMSGGTNKAANLRFDDHKLILKLIEGNEIENSLESYYR